MSQNTELVNALKRVLADSEFIIKTLGQNAGVDEVTASNYKVVLSNLDSTSGVVLRNLFEVLDDVEAVSYTHLTLPTKRIV